MRYDKAERDRAEKAQRKRAAKIARIKARRLSSKRLVSKNCSDYNKTKWVIEEDSRQAQQKIDKEFQKRLDENSAKHEEQTILKVIKKSEKENK